MAFKVERHALLPEELEFAMPDCPESAGEGLSPQGEHGARDLRRLNKGVAAGISLAASAAAVVVLYGTRYHLGQRDSSARAASGGSAMRKMEDWSDERFERPFGVEHPLYEGDDTAGSGGHFDVFEDDYEGPHSNAAIAAFEAKRAADNCADAGQSCLESKCCKGHGMQCFTKDAWWAQCMAECTPGPNLLDQSSNAPWECKALGDRTEGEPAECSADGEDCRDTGCCKEPGTQCFEKNEFWATCRSQCTPGPDLFADDSSRWTCKSLGPRTLGAAPWVAQQCAHQGEDCRAKGCCADADNQCYKQSDYYATCLQSCEPGMKRNTWEPAWSCDAIGPRTPKRFESPSGATAVGKVSSWVAKECAAEGANCLDSECCQAVGAQCFVKTEFWGSCRPDCSTEPDPNDGNRTWTCEKRGPRGIGLSIKGWPSLFCITLFMPSSYEGDLLRRHVTENAGIFQCDGYDVFAADEASLGTTKDGIEVRAVLIPKIPVGRSQDGTAGNAKLFMAVWDKVIAGGRFRNYDWTIKVDPDAVLIPWRIRDHVRPHVGKNVYVVNCNKFPGSPNFPMMYGAVEVFSSAAMIAYAMNSWRCGQQLPWGAWGEDYYMTHCMDFVGVGRIGDFGILGDNMCTGANCADGGIASFHPFKTQDSWIQCWTQATATAR